jgi:purine-binding chemotaxis protein CheW
MDKDSSTREIVAFTAGGQEFGVDVMAVREIRGWTPETPLPQAPPNVRGVINLRGAILPIIDLSARLGLMPSTPDARHVIIVLAQGARLIGILVDAVGGIIPIDDGALRDSAGVGGGTIAGLLNVQDQLIGILAIEEVFRLKAEAA